MPVSASPKRFTLITAVYNVNRSLPGFFASIENQDFDLGQVEIIAVDDGSTDDSQRLARSSPGSGHRAVQARRRATSASNILVGNG